MFSALENVYCIHSLLVLVFKDVWKYFKSSFSQMHYKQGRINSITGKCYLAENPSIFLNKMLIKLSYIPFCKMKSMKEKVTNTVDRTTGT